MGQSNSIESNKRPIDIDESYFSEVSVGINGDYKTVILFLNNENIPPANEITDRVSLDNANVGIVKFTDEKNGKNDDNNDNNDNINNIINIDDLKYLKDLGYHSFYTITPNGFDRADISDMKLSERPKNAILVVNQYTATFRIPHQFMSFWDFFTKLENIVSYDLEQLLSISHLRIFDEKTTDMVLFGEVHHTKRHSYHHELDKLFQKFGDKVTVLTEANLYDGDNFVVLDEVRHELTEWIYSIYRDIITADDAILDDLTYICFVVNLFFLGKLIYDKKAVEFKEAKKFLDVYEAWYTNDDDNDDNTADDNNDHKYHPLISQHTIDNLAINFDIISESHFPKYRWTDKKGDNDALFDKIVGYIVGNIANTFQSYQKTSYTPDDERKTIIKYLSPICDILMFAYLSNADKDKIYVVILGNSHARSIIDNKNFFEINGANIVVISDKQNKKDGTFNHHAEIDKIVNNISAELAIQGGFDFLYKKESKFGMMVIVGFVVAILIAMLIYLIYLCFCESDLNTTNFNDDCSSDVSDRRNR